MEGTKVSRRSITIDDHLWEELQKLAQKKSREMYEKVSVSFIIRAAIRQYIAQHE